MGEVADMDYDLSGLSKTPDAMQLHQSHQARGGFGPGTRYVQTFDFNNMAYGQSNIIQIPAVDMVVDEAYVELNIAALASTTGGAFMPTYWFLGSQGCQLLAKGQSVYTAQSNLVRDYRKMNTDSNAQLNQMLYLTNDNGVVAGALRGTVANDYIIDLKCLVDAVLGKAGTISAFPSNYWSLDVNLKNLNQLVHSATGSVAATGGAITSAKLVLVGHKEEQQVISNQTSALANDGIKITYSQPNYKSQTIANASIADTVSLPDIQGNVSHIWLLERASAGLVGTAPNTVADTPKLNNLPTDTVSIGTTNNPYSLWGRALPEVMARWGIQGYSYLGSSSFASPVLASTIPYQSGLIAVPACEKGSSDMMHGVYSGSFRVNNNFLITLVHADPTAAQTMDVIVFVRRVLVLGLNGILASINEE